MDDIMILMNNIVIDVLSSFNETQFGIFDDDEKDELLCVWNNCDRKYLDFLNILSPIQKERVAIWASNRTKYSVEELIKALKKFIKFLESSSYRDYKLYPKPVKSRKKSKPNKKKNPK